MEPTQSVTLAFTASAQVWKVVADHWYGESRDYAPELHKAAEKLLADIDEAINRPASREDR